MTPKPVELPMSKRNASAQQPSMRPQLTNKAAPKEDVFDTFSENSQKSLMGLLAPLQTNTGSKIREKSAQSKQTVVVTQANETKKQAVLPVQNTESKKTTSVIPPQTAETKKQVVPAIKPIESKKPFEKKEVKKITTDVKKSASICDLRQLSPKETLKTSV